MWVTIGGFNLSQNDRFNTGWANESGGGGGGVIPILEPNLIQNKGKFIERAVFP
jgi:hypothetical protein